MTCNTKRESDARVVLRGDADYPKALSALPDPPEKLYARGALCSPWALAVALVGSRGADPGAQRLAFDIAGRLAEAGIVIVSGGARGIDAAAHRGALEAGGYTAAILGSGFDNAYPSVHRELFDKIARGGGVVLSEFEPSTPPSRWTFPRRNRIIAALSQIVAVVQAPERSGALITARIARRLGVKVAAVPGPAGCPHNRGNNALIRTGASLIESAEDVVALLAHREPHFQLDLPEPKRRGKETPAKAPTDLGADEQKVFDSLDRTAVHIDVLAVSTGLGAARTQAALLSLELAGIAEDRGGKQFARID